MNRINKLFKQKKSGILSLFFTAGCPNKDNVASTLKALQDGGIDMVELGIPFSDPMADGTVIQASSTAALRNGMSLRELFAQLEGIRKTIEIPIIMMGYLNPIMQYGFERFCEKCVEVGVDGMIIPDMPYEEYISTYKPVADRFDLRMIMLITPETEEERVRLIDENTDGFIYMVSSAATTGSQKSFDEKKQEYFHRIDSMKLKNPRMIGFGISNRATLEAAFANSSGAIIGSKFVQLLSSELSPEAAVNKLKEELKK
jgi:tryptophan synthase alpha chain